jgi:hypothetical protein
MTSELENIMNDTSERGPLGGRQNQFSGTSGKGSERSSSGIGAQSSEPVRQAAATAKEQPASVADSAKDLASKASEKVVSAVQEQKAAGANFVSGMASSMRRAANEFGQIPQAAQYMRLAADQIDSASDAFRRRDLNQLVSDVQGFARRQPTAFFGVAVLAGFAVVRFLKTSTGANAATESHQGSVMGSESVPGYPPHQPLEAKLRQAGM